ncbi:putative Fatty acid-binding protein, heart [Hypsibius exemplaris]|uniref:Fatty acid-binding protein, heart n=1 Tax=Hypsibius exemplaris TaxID=2072580 RepID=A0A1W0WV62_HYPEX|nr:putative Fatty acid-binding protein, heart [Hypsibius exemplaris]
MADITGKYSLESSENFDEYMQSIGVGFLKRKAASALSTAVVDITKTGPDAYVLKTTTTLKTTELPFVLNKEVPETTIDGREVKALFTLDGNILKQKQTGADGFESTIDREFTPTGLIATLYHKNVTAVRKYKKV